jgi:hypothetical protein
MATYEIKTPTRTFERITSGERPWLIVTDDEDIQTGDTIDLVEVGPYGHRVRDFIERDARGRFVNAHVDRPAVPLLVTHVAAGRHTDGVDDDQAVLSVALAEDAA